MSSSGIRSLHHRTAEMKSSHEGLSGSAGKLLLLCLGKKLYDRACAGGWAQGSGRSWWWLFLGIVQIIKKPNKGFSSSSSTCTWHQIRGKWMENREKNIFSSYICETLQKVSQSTCKIRSFYKHNCITWPELPRLALLKPALIWKQPPSAVKPIHINERRCSVSGQTKGRTKNGITGLSPPLCFCPKIALYYAWAIFVLLINLLQNIF